MKNLAICCALSPLLLFSSPLAAADQLFRGTLDGKAHEWHVLMAEGHSSSYFSDQGGWIDVTLQGHAEQRFSTKGALSISMLSMGGQPPDEVEVIYFPEATMLPNFNSEDQDAGLEISKFAINGDELHIAGRYRGSLRYVETMRPQSPSSRHMDIDVEFDLVVPRQD
jgi:hypothetical protein